MTCPKCGTGAMVVKYCDYDHTVKAWICDHRPKAPEHLDLVCLGCGYATTKSCADAGKEGENK